MRLMDSFWCLAPEQVRLAFLRMRALCFMQIIPVFLRFVAAQHLGRVKYFCWSD